MTTRDRPTFLPVALECYRRQTYEPRELLVVDDGTRFPADPRAVAGVGGRIVRVAEDMTLGAKLNRGAQEARGSLCLKWDDDDWYAPRFLETLVAAHRRRASLSGAPVVAYLTVPFLFDLVRWRFLPWNDDDPCGATMLFEREQWARAPSQDVRD
jgi:glycosyltransferase involved in cell wall biosynthesis